MDAGCKAHHTGRILREAQVRTKEKEKDSIKTPLQKRGGASSQSYGMSVLILELEIEARTAHPNFFIVGPVCYGVGLRMVDITGWGFRFADMLNNQGVHFGQLLVQLPQVENTLFTTSQHLTGRPQCLLHCVLHPLSFEFKPFTLQFKLQ